MAEDLQQYIYEHIPIIKQNNFTINLDPEEHILVHGQYLEHINHRNSVFGGSLSTSLILSAWAYARKIVQDHNCGQTIIVIQSQEVKYLEPVTQDFLSYALEVSSAEVNKLIGMLNKFSKSRIAIEAVLTHEGGGPTLASFRGEFVLVKPK